MKQKLISSKQQNIVKKQTEMAKGLVIMAEKVASKPQMILTPKSKPVMILTPKPSAPTPKVINRWNIV